MHKIVYKRKTKSEKDNHTERKNRAKKNQINKQKQTTKTRHGKLKKLDTKK
jgi:hypothetical protein